ncbi:carboxynorspermidine decarboxylase [Caproicibacter fermentans]|uniref:Carboxynorspermidine decarboxylase n=1 Tax=Caproicibacter fermentans TaxID=2576756 RepID=A0A7G8T9P5_9FIRM|nr:carboxynorspermidine decarboxylase [Caproicibacter fermentans]QNK40336.1 carboxynorspermidine decarboxylase [Caproicibacter fermentans]
MRQEAGFDPMIPPTPCYVVDEQLLTQNLRILDSVRKETGCRILLAQKAFSMFSVYPLIGKYLDGAASSSLFEARLAREEMGKEVHIYAPAYRDDEFGEILKYSDHIVFNSFSQWGKYRAAVRECPRKISCGIRVNPEYSEIETGIYDPCGEFSRLGVTLSNFRPEELDGVEGLHFHTLCEQGAETLDRTLRVFEEKFGRFLSAMKWVNFGGGHHITKPGYNLALLKDCIRRVRDKYGVQVYLEPGEAIALNTGFLISTVLDVTENGMGIAILDTSAACHMPDVLEMPYRPEIVGAGRPGELQITYRLGGPTCLAGDVIGDYSFREPLKPGDRLVFCDMAIYSMVKNNTFNGIGLPAILLYGESEGFRMVRQFGYEDFKTRLS